MSESSAAIIGDYLAHGAICPRILACEKRQVMLVTSEVAARALGVKAGAVFDALMEREAVASTGLGHGVALPHALVRGVERISGVFLRLKPPVDFAAIDDEPVDLVLALLAPPELAGEHLRALARSARALRSAELRRQLRLASGADAIRALMSRDERPRAA